MATNDQENKAATGAVAPETATPKTATPKMVKIRTSKPETGGEKTRFIGVNGKGYRIALGKELEVPAAVAEVLRNAELAQDVMDAHIEKNEYREESR